MNTDTQPRQYWEAAARKIRRRINLGFCLQTFLPVLLGLAFLQGCLVVAARKLDAPVALLWIFFGAAVLLAAAGSAWWNRRKFFSLQEALVHLEARLSLHNRLTTAGAGLAQWPEPRPIPAQMRWSWRRIVLPALTGASFLLLAGWIPLPPETDPRPTSPEEPAAWAQVESWAETLAQQDMVEEDALTRWQEQVRKLRDQPAQEWYSHNSLEAGDNLRDTAADAIRRLQSGLQKAAYPLTVAQEYRDDLPSGLQPLLRDHWLEAVSDLGSGPLPLSREMLDQLAEVDFENLPALAEGEIESIQKMLREGAEACRISGDGGEECEGEGDGCATCTGTAPGTGGINRGPGEAPLTFQEFPSLLDLQKKEAVSNPDLSRAALGENLGTTQSAPKIERESFSGPTAAGAVTGEADGGEAVWRSQFTPAEQQRLRNYFD